uniref:Uncharacterized protein n=1 Tax=Amphimedon queenslandica TaxID=400682 RepID=A0A1X7VQ11_AMPQE
MTKEHTYCIRKNIKMKISLFVTFDNLARDLYRFWLNFKATLKIY